MFNFMLSTTLLARILKKQKVGSRSWKPADLGFPMEVSRQLAKMYLSVHSYMFNEFIFEGVDCTLGVIPASDLY